VWQFALWARRSISVVQRTRRKQPDQWSCDFWDPWTRGSLKYKTSASCCNNWAHEAGNVFWSCDVSLETEQRPGASPLHGPQPKLLDAQTRTSHGRHTPNQITARHAGNWEKATAERGKPSSREREIQEGCRDGRKGWVEMWRESEREADRKTGRIKKVGLKVKEKSGTNMSLKSGREWVSKERVNGEGSPSFTGPWSTSAAASWIFVKSFRGGAPTYQLWV